MGVGEGHFNGCWTLAMHWAMLIVLAYGPAPRCLRTVRVDRGQALDLFTVRPDDRSGRGGEFAVTLKLERSAEDRSRTCMGSRVFSRR